MSETVEQRIKRLEEQERNLVVLAKMDPDYRDQLASVRRRIAMLREAERT